MRLAEAQMMTPARRTRMNIRHVAPATPKLQRIFKHVYNSARKEGHSDKDALRIAAATVNQYRAEHGLTIEERGRRGWWPGKKIRSRR